MDTFNCIVETPAGQQAKITQDLKTGHLEISKLLPMGLAFPFDFGYIEGTMGEDGDPLDVIILSELKTYPGCMLQCRIIGAIQAQQTEKNGHKVRNDRFLAIPVISRQYETVSSLEQLPPLALEQMKLFFKNYNEQTGKKFKPLKEVGVATAMKEIVKTFSAAMPVKLLQIFLPLYDKKGKAFPGKYYAEIKKQLTEMSGGVTIYKQTAAGTWKEDGYTEKDEMVVIEVMLKTIEKKFWRHFRQQMEKRFEQDVILIRYFGIGVL